MRVDRKLSRVPSRYRIRKKVIGVAERPRVAIYRSLKHIYLQAVDDAQGQTLVSASSMDADLRAKLKSGGGNIKGAGIVGELMAQRLKEKGIDKIVFDRGGFIYHGRIKAAAEAMRKAGIQF